MKRILFHRMGLSLMEVIVAVGLLAVVSLVANNIFFGAMRGALKTEAIKEVKQNGDFSLTVMKNAIRNAIQVVDNSDGQKCPGTATPMAKLKIELPGELGPTNQFVEYYAEDVGGVRKIKEVTTVGLNPPVVEYITRSSVTVDTTAQDLAFTCDPSTNTITIQFVLTHAVTINAKAEERATLAFEGIIVLRNRP